MSIAVERSASARVADVAAWSRAWRSREIREEATLAVAVIDDDRDAVVLGAFQRGDGVKRGSGGARVHASRGTIYVGLVLPRPDALVSCDAPRLVNRYVRPILRATTTMGSPARYFGRDWIDVGKRPVASIGFAHEASSGRSMVEAFLGVRAPFTSEARESFLGKTPASLDEVLAKPVDLAKLADAIVHAFASSYARAAIDAGELAIDRHDDARAIDPEWSAREPEIIGDVCAGADARGVMRVGGDLLASADAIEALEARLASLSPSADEAEIARAVNETLAAPGVVVDGLRSLESVARVIARAQNRA